MQILKYILIFCVINISRITIGKSQHYNANLEFFTNQKILSKIQFENKNIHSSFKPVLLDSFTYLNTYNSVFYKNKRDKNLSVKFKSNWIYRKIRKENFLEYKSSDFSVIVNPLLNIEQTKGKNYDENFFINTRGIEIKGNIGKKISYYSAFYENQARFVPHVARYVKTHLVAPGQGAVKILKNNKFDFSQAIAYLNLNINENIKIQLGNGKHFIGDGYRSLLLSDNSFSYPYLKLNFSYKQLNYILLWSEYQTFKTAYYNYHNRKYSSISYLSWTAKNFLELSLFESIIFPGNTTNNRNNFNLNYFNPLMLSRTGIYGLDNEKNILLGLNVRLKLYKYAQVFAQFALDNIDNKLKANNKYAFQIGFKHFDLLHNKLQNTTLLIHTEVNYISHYTYTKRHGLQTYTHYNQPIAHIAGSGLTELIAILSLTFRDFCLNGKFAVLNNVADKNNIQKDMESEQNIINSKIELSYMINPVNNLQVFVSFSIRSNNIKVDDSDKLKLLTFGIRTNINNFYYDF